MGGRRPRALPQHSCRYVIRAFGGETEHEVDVLCGLPGGALAQVVGAGDEQRLALCAVLEDVDLHQVAAVQRLRPELPRTRFERHYAHEALASVAGGER